MLNINPSKYLLELTLITLLIPGMTYGGDSQDVTVTPDSACSKIGSTLKAPTNCKYTRMGGCMCECNNGNFSQANNSNCNK